MTMSPASRTRWFAYRCLLLGGIEASESAIGVGVQAVGRDGDVVAHTSHAVRVSAGADVRA
jgi:hypothetical protein